MDLQLFRMATLAMTLVAAGCAGDPRSTAPLSATATERLAAVKLDTAAATRIFNAYRASQGLGPVRLDPTLTAMAQHQANAMAAANMLSHDAGGSFVSRVHGAGLNAGRTAENVGGGYYSTEEAFAGWKASSGHDINLRMPEATRFGIALAKAPQTQYGAWWALEIAGEPEKRREITTGPFGASAPAIR
ncbi:Cysteine-rich secretory protein family protein [Bosea sp. OK403]|uniref:CAP domain-containing protein n=1 Tax=Bosea sp. OK403 TaxID=1855286 RepID=UPI0008DF0A8B|nr:CAP domain-containing protein [Bosea sp. OK403]SFI33640.1 Cysteine-rich secretory protein family protein [Bosea sp. OK403]